HWCLRAGISEHQSHRSICSGGFFSVQRPAHDSSISPTSAWKARPSSLESAPSNASA
ncbi:Putative zinc finger/helix-turn-helix protein, YgiT family, partial [Dysosmobacter welbionis]